MKLNQIMLAAVVGLSLLLPAVSESASSLSAGGQHTCAVTTVGGLKCLGVKHIWPAREYGDVCQPLSSGCDGTD